MKNLNVVGWCANSFFASPYELRWVRGKFDVEVFPKFDGIVIFGLSYEGKDLGFGLDIDSLVGIIPTDSALIVAG